MSDISWEWDQTTTDISFEVKEPSEEGGVTPAEVAAAIGAHSSAADPHGDRVWANERFAPVVHNHDDRYAGFAHTHSGLYLPVGTTAEDVGAAPAIHTHPYIPISEKGLPGGVAELDSSGKVPSSQLPDTTASDAVRLPGWAFTFFGNVETIPAFAPTGTLTLTSGRAYLAPIRLEEGEPVSAITFVSGVTAGASMTHQWFALCDANCVIIRATNDDTSNAWGGSVHKTLHLPATYIIPASGVYRLAIMVSGSTPPNLRAASSVSGIGSLCINGNSGYGDVPPIGTDLNFGASAQGGSTPYAYVS